MADPSQGGRKVAARPDSGSAVVEGTDILRIGHLTKMRSSIARPAPTDTSDGPRREFDVVHVSSVHRWDDNRIFTRECRSLVAAGYRVALVARAEESRIVDGVAVTPVATFRSRPHRVVAGLPRLAATLSRIPGRSYHLHDPELIALVPWLRLRRARVVYDAHEDLPMQMLGKDFPLRGANRLFSLLARLVCSVAGVTCNGVVAATPTVARRFPPARTRVVRNLPEVADEVVEPYDQRPDVVTYVGALTTERGAPQMIEAAQRVLPEHWELRLVGPEYPTGLMQSLLPEHPTCPITWTGQLAPPDARAEIARAKIGLVVLQPTRAYIDALPTKLFEYMAAGLPVVASDFPAWRAIVEHNRCGLLVDPCRAEAVAEAVRFLINHPDEAMRMGERGRRDVKERLNWEAEKGTLVDLYDRLLIRQSGR